MFTLSALVTLALGFWFGCEAWRALISDMQERKSKNRFQHVIADLLFIVGFTCVAITAVHDLTTIWIK